MTTYLAAFLLLSLVVAGMAIGVLIQGRRLRGSCGLTGDDCACSALRAHTCSHARAPDRDGVGGGSARRGARSSGSPH